MGTVHDILEARGKQAALLEGLERSEVEAAASYLADEETGIGFLYSGWCQAALPHRRLPDSQGWQVTSERVTLVVEPGMRPDPSGRPAHVGVPYGSRARLIMLYLQGEAIRTGCREVELGRSLRAWLTRMSIPAGGKSIDAVRDQADRISRCKLSFHAPAGVGKGLINQNIVDTAMFVDMENEDKQGSLFVEKACLSLGFFEQLQKHSVPLEEAAIRAINNNSQALDVYCWLAYRLHSLRAPTSVSWRALKGQFGAGFGRMDHFRNRFVPNLKLALSVYPAAKLDVEAAGVVLHPSRPPVAPRVRAIG